MASPGIPANLSEVTPAWLTAALRAGGVLSDGQRITEAHLEDVDGLAMTAQVRRVVLSGDGPAAVILKLSRPGWLGSFRRELRFYTELSPSLRLRHPRLLLHLAGDERAVCLLEHIAGRHAREGLSAAQLTDLLGGLAAMHAGWWDAPRFAALPLRYPAEKVRRIRARMEAAWAAVAAIPGQPGIAAVAPAVAAAFAQLEDIHRRLDSGPRTLVHRDLHVDNLLVRGDDVIALDWSDAGGDHLIKDVAWALAADARPGVRAGADWVARYHRALTEAAGRPLLSLPQLRADFRAGVAWLFFWEVCFMADWMEREGRIPEIMVGEWDRLRHTMQAIWGAPSDTGGR